METESEVAENWVVGRDEFDRVYQEHRRWVDTNGFLNFPVDGVEGRQAVFEKVSFTGIDFEGMDLSYVSFVRCDMSHTSFDGCKFRGSDISFCNVEGSTFRDAAFFDATLWGSRAHGCDFTGARMYETSLSLSPKGTFLDNYGRKVTNF